MRIDEIQPEETVILEICKDKRTAEVHAEVYQRMQNVLVLKPIMVDGKFLNLDDAGVKLNMVYVREGEKPLLWRFIAFTIYRQANLPYVVLSDKRDGVEHNRRRTFRLDLDVQGVLNKNEKVIIRDISSTGISFYTPKEKELELDSTVMLKFTGGYEEITVTGKVVRKQDCDNRMLHGCTINSSPKVDKFISEEQMRRLKKHR